MSEKEENPQQSKSFVQHTTTSNKMKITKKIHTDVGFNETGLSFTTIGTSAVSTCHFYLLIGYFSQIRFAFLYHSGSDYPSSTSDLSSTSDSSPTSDSSSIFDTPKTYTPTSAVVEIIEYIAKDLQAFLVESFTIPPEYSPFDFVKNIQLLIGGSTKLQPDLIYDGFRLLNDIETNRYIQQQLQQPEQRPPLHLVQKLCYKIRFIKAITYFQRERDLKKGHRGVAVSEPPCLTVKFDCEWNIANLIIEWWGISLSCAVASMVIDCNDIAGECVWEVEQHEIDEAVVKIGSNLHELSELKKAVDLLLTAIDLNACEDLINEVCSIVCAQVNSPPKIIDQLERQKLQLNVEATAFSEEKDQTNEVNIENPQVKMVEAKREKKSALVVDMKYGTIPEKEPEITEENKQQQDRLSNEIVVPNIFIETVSQWAGIPVSKLSRTDNNHLLKLSQHLRAKIIGQEHVIDNIVTILINRAEVPRQNQPMGSFLFLGPTGVGKTELAKTLALELFDSIKSMIHINMSEYIESHSVARLIDVSQGYVGQLIESVQQQPYTVILFDEVEKAHPRIWDILLQVLNGDCLADEQGRIVDFINTIIILSSNIGAQYILEEVKAPTYSEKTSDGKLSRTIKDLVMKEVRLHFRSEFLNRLDDIVFFQPLNVNHLSSIVHLQLRSLEERFKEQDITIILTDKAMQSTLKKPYNSVNDIRPLKCYLEEQIITELSKLLIQRKLAPHCHVIIDTDANDQYKFDIQQSTTVTSTSILNRPRTCDELDKESAIKIDNDEEYDNQFSGYDDNKDSSQASSKRMKRSSK